jgi:hypothetical protein
MLQSVHVFEAQVLRKSLGSEFEIAWDTQFSITHAAPPCVSLPAVSSIGALRAPAPVRAAVATAPMIYMRLRPMRSDKCPASGIVAKDTMPAAMSDVRRKSRETCRIWVP